MFVNLIQEVAVCADTWVISQDNAQMHIYLTDITGVGTDHVLDKAYTEIVDIDTNTEEDLGPEAMTITDPDPGPDHTTTKGEIVQEIIDID